MKMITTCMECFKEKGYPNFEFMSADITDDGMYKLKCNKGHETYQIINDEKFEVLFDLGVSALNNGYKFEAVACFATALERFHEWFINLMLVKNNIDESKFEKTWKYVIKQSERQLGAFYFFYLNEFNETPEMLNENKVKFRNDVIHKGKIASYEEIVDYGEYVLGYIRRVLKKLDGEYNDKITEIVFNRYNKLRDKYNMKNQPISFGNTTTIIGLNYNDKKHKEMTFEEALEYIKEREKMLGGVIDECKGIDRKVK